MERLRKFLAPLSSQTICLSRHGRNFHRAYFFVEPVLNHLDLLLLARSGRDVSASIREAERKRREASANKGAAEETGRRGRGGARSRERDTPEKGWQLGKRVKRRGSSGCYVRWTRDPPLSYDPVDLVSIKVINFKFNNMPSIAGYNERVCTHSNHSLYLG